MPIPSCFLSSFVMFVHLFVSYFVAPHISFKQMMYSANEHEEVQVVLVLDGVSSINVTVYISTLDGSATGKHSF